jgi:hypothetical protein
MSKLLWKSLLLTTALFASANVSAVSAQTASDNSQILNQIDQYNREGVNLNQTNGTQGQVRSITELRDVSPSDWAYDALRNLVENYDCIEGYPNRTYRGERALTRYEFAAGLNSCLDAIMSQMGPGGLDPAELDQIRRLVREFEAELATLGTRVDDLEGRVAILEDNQFSTTTKLRGEAIFALTDVFGGDVNVGGVNVGSLGKDNNTIFGDRVRLTLESSFTGDDRLITRLAAGNLSAFGTTVGGNTITHPETTQTFNLSPGNNNDVAIDWAAYYLPVGKADLYIAATGGVHYDYVSTNNPFFEDGDGGSGALSVFASRNPIYNIGGGAGLGLNVPLGDKATVSLGYLADEAPNPANGNGLFNGNYSALGQIDFALGETFNIGLAYVHAYKDATTALFDIGSRNGVTGTTAANRPSVISGLPATQTASNSYGGSVAWQPSSKVSISGFFNYTDAILIGQGGAEIWSYGLGVAFPDLGKEGNVLGIFGGAQPYAGYAVANRGVNVPYHVEAFYKYQVNDNISITPGLIWLTNPEGDALGNAVDDAFIGTLRTTFTF